MLFGCALIATKSVYTNAPCLEGAIAIIFKIHKIIQKSDLHPVMSPVKFSIYWASIMLSEAWAIPLTISRHSSYILRSVSCSASSAFLARPSNSNLYSVGRKIILQVCRHQSSSKERRAGATFDKVQTAGRCTCCPHKRESPVL